MRRPNRRPTYLKMEDISNWTETANYIIYQKDSNIIGINGSTGKQESINTDAQTVFQAIVDLATSGDLIFIKDGIYTFTDTLNLGSSNYGITLRGQSNSGTILILDDNADCDLIADTSAFATTKMFFSMYNLRLFGNSANNASGSGVNLTPTGAAEHYDCIFRDLQIYDFADNCMTFGHVHDYLIDKCILENSTMSISAAEGSYLRVTNSTLGHNSSYGIYSQASPTFISNSIIIDNGDIGIVGDDKLTVTNCNIWGNDDTAIYTYLNDYICVTNNVITGSTTQKKGITVYNGAQHCKISNNACYGHSTYNYSLAKNSNLGTTINGIGWETAAAEEPQSTYWNMGDIVDFVDSADGSGDGLYILDTSGNWVKIN